MLRATVCIGAPGSGKSTWAQGRPERFDSNRDRIRLQLTGKVDDHSHEDLVTRIQREELRAAADIGRDVIVSDTNLNQAFRKELIEFLEKLGYEAVLRLFRVPLAELHHRNAAREKPVPGHVIDRMFVELEEQFGRAGLQSPEA